MTPAAARHLDLARRLAAMANDMAASRTLTLSDGAIGELPELVKVARQQILDDGEPRLIDVEAACVVDLLIALTYARAAKNAARESRLVMFLNSFVTFLKIDLANAERAAGIAVTAAPEMRR